MAGASTLLLDEYFESGDSRFVGEVLASTSAAKLKAFAPRWLKDPRPFARDALLAYVDEGCDRPFHKPLVKTLFKAAEANADLELLAHFLVAFDRLARRRLVTRRTWDWQARETLETQALVDDTGVPARALDKDAKPFAKGPAAQRFSRTTRHYLRRRAWRFFRNVAKQDPASYGRAIRYALSLYEDDRLSKAEHLLDAWGLCHALYWGSPVLERDRRGVRVAEGRTLLELEPAPYCPEGWKDCAEETLALAAKAKSLTVRAYAIKWLRTHEKAALQGLCATKLVPLLKSRHEEVQVFGALLLGDAQGLETLRVAEWMELLSVENASVSGAVARLAEKHVKPDRLELAQLVELACRPLAPAAELGLKWLKNRAIVNEADYLSLFALANARAPSVRAEACAWLGELIAFAPWAKALHVRELLDARFEEARRPALELFAKLTKYRDDVLLWGALAESPYPDVRDALVTHLTARRKALAPATLRFVWATTLLAVQRGGKAKVAALSQLGRRLVEHPSEAEELLPLVALALRSVRAPERRHALAALALAGADPAVSKAIAMHLPDVRVGAEVSA